MGIYTRPAIAVLLWAALSATALGAPSVGPARTPPKAPATTTPAAPGAPATPAAPASSIDEMFARMKADALKGKLTDALLNEYKDLAAAMAWQNLKAAGVSEEFWTWLGAHKDLRDPMLLALFPKYDPEAFKCLEALKAKFGDQVVQYHHLALAFALVYGRAGNKPVRGPEVSFTEKDRPVPTMEESFAWYLKSERAMKMPLKTTPWPLMVFVADNDLPIEERNWALNHYAALAPQGYGKIYYEVPYKTDLVGKNGATDRVWTLATILSEGGVCMHRAYFASRVLKSFGVPSLYDRGEGDRGGHAWTGWIGREKESIALVFTGRFDYDRYYTGEVFSPTARRMMLDRNVELLAVAVARSYPGYLDAIAASQICSQFEGDDCMKVVGLLEGAVQKNPYCDFPWRLTAVWCAQGGIPQPKGEKMYDGMLKTFAAYPDLTFEVLRQILEPRLKPAAKPPEAEITRNLQLLDRAFAVYDAAKRPDLAVLLKALQGQYLEAVDRRDEALKLYVAASEKYATEHYGFVVLYERAVKILQEDKKQDLLLKYMGQMAGRVPEYQADFNRKYDLKNPAWVLVLKTYAGALRAAGRAGEADSWEAKLPKPKK